MLLRDMFRTVGAWSWNVHPIDEDLPLGLIQSGPFFAIFLWVKQ
jgi:hypothetical protein